LTNCLSANNLFSIHPLNKTSKSQQKGIIW
jgi:hypothetical protein